MPVAATETAEGELEDCVADNDGAEDGGSNLGTDHVGHTNTADAKGSQWRDEQTDAKQAGESLLDRDFVRVLSVRALVLSLSVSGLLLRLCVRALSLSVRHLLLRLPVGRLALCLSVRALLVRLFGVETTMGPVVCSTLLWTGCCWPRRFLRVRSVMDTVNSSAHIAVGGTRWHVAVGGTRWLVACGVLLLLRHCMASVRVYTAVVCCALRDMWCALSGAVTRLSGDDRSLDGCMCFSWGL